MNAGQNPTREEKIIAGIKRGIADVKAGRAIPHEEAMHELDMVIEKTAALTLNSPDN